MGSSEPVIFEAVGVDGKREVGFLNMTQREVDAAEYDQLFAGKGRPRRRHAQINRCAAFGAIAPGSLRRVC